MRFRSIISSFDKNRGECNIFYVNLTFFMFLFLFLTTEGDDHWDYIYHKSSINDASKLLISSMGSALLLLVNFNEKSNCCNGNAYMGKITRVFRFTKFSRKTIFLAGFFLVNLVGLLFTIWVNSCYFKNREKVNFKF